MPVRISHGALANGVMGQLVEVQAHLSNGLPSMTIVGLPDTSISEARDRVRAAVASCGFTWPTGRITVGLSPAFEHKRGSILDLAIAMAVLAAADTVPAAAVADTIFLGELGLDGSLRAVPGAIAMALAIVKGRPDCQIVASPQTAAQISAVPGWCRCRRSICSRWYRSSPEWPPLPKSTRQPQPQPQPSPRQIWRM